MKVDGNLVTTVYDILLAQYGVEREGIPGEWPTGYDDVDAVPTPAWQETHTGVPANAAVRIGREFAQNAIDSKGRSMVILGAGVNHYYHADTMYRTILALTSMCATQGVNGGGWAHYVGQEKVRPITGWAQFAFGLDWVRPARQMITTGFFYLITDQWRYDGTPVDKLRSPLADLDWKGKSTADTLVESMKRGWMPSFPTFDRSTLLLGQEAREAGMPGPAYVVDQLEKGELKFAAEDPDNPENFPRILTSWRTNLLGNTAKGAEFFYRHMVGTDDAVSAAELPEDRRPESMVWREAAASGKVDLMMTVDFRNTTTTLMSDLVLPAATWYEKRDLSSTDMHPYIHAFDAAIDPPWEARTDYEIFQSWPATFPRWRRFTSANRPTLSRFRWRTIPRMSTQIRVELSPTSTRSPSPRGSTCRSWCLSNVTTRHSSIVSTPWGRSPTRSAWSPRVSSMTRRSKSRPSANSTGRIRATAGHRSTVPRPRAT